MSTILDVTAPAFRGIKNPYTGEPVKVRMLVPKTGKPLFFAPDDYSVRDRYPTRREAVFAWNRVDGVGGMKDNQPFRCAYTGETLRPVSNGAQAWFEGGFDPHLLRSREEFLYYATMRDGVSKYPKPGPAKAPVKAGPHVSGLETPPEAGTSAETEISPEALKVGEKIAEKLAPEKKTRVSMSVPKKRK